METPAKIAIADDHALFRNGLKGLLCMDGSCEVAGEASDGEELMALLASGMRPDVVLLDIDLPRMDGFATAGRIADEYPDIKIITLSMHGDEEYYFRMLSLGAKGFLLKNSDIDEVRAAIRAVMRGGTYFSQELLTMLVGTLHTPAAAPAAEALSERELEILRLVCHGLSNQEIADRLFISKRTVDKHRANILEKTCTKNTANLVIWAVRNSLVEV